MLDKYLEYFNRIDLEKNYNMLCRIPLIPDYFFFCLPSSAFFVFKTSQVTQDTSISTNTGSISTNTADIDTLEVNMI